MRSQDGRAVQGHVTIYLQLICIRSTVSRPASASVRMRSTNVSSSLFFAALAPAELDVYDQVLASLSGEREQLERAREQQIERLRYQARLAERQYQQVRS